MFLYNRIRSILFLYRNHMEKTFLFFEDNNCMRLLGIFTILSTKNPADSNNTFFFGIYMMKALISTAINLGKG